MVIIVYKMHSRDTRRGLPIVIWVLVWVFVVLVSVIGLVAVVLYFTTSTGGGEKDHFYGDPSRQFHLPRNGYGPFGGFPHL